MTSGFFDADAVSTVSAVGPLRFALPIFFLTGGNHGMFCSGSSRQPSTLLSCVSRRRYRSAPRSCARYSTVFFHLSLLCLIVQGWRSRGSCQGWLPSVATGLSKKKGWTWRFFASHLCSVSTHVPGFCNDVTTCMERGRARTPPGLRLLVRRPIFRPPWPQGVSFLKAVLDRRLTQSGAGLQRAVLLQRPARQLLTNHRARRLAGVGR